MIRALRVVVISALLGAASAVHAGAEPELYEVHEGDTLWSIADVALGDASLWPALYRVWPINCAIFIISARRPDLSMKRIVTPRRN